MADPSIGIFDSGVGGLSVLREIQSVLPDANIVYFADQAHVPYGSRTLEEVRGLSEGITRFLAEQGSELIVLACNTASAAALHSLRESLPDIPFVGMEPAVKPAAQRTETRKVAVLATPATFQGALFESVVERFAQGVEVIEIVIPGLVKLIEQRANQGEMEGVLRDALDPATKQGIDTIVLACTHYSFAIPEIQGIVGPHVTVIDPAPAIARQAARLWKPTAQGSKIRYITSGEPSALRSSLLDLIGHLADPEPASWRAGQLRIA